MVFKGLITAVSAVALSATPALAAGSNARAASAAVAPAVENIDEGSELGRGRRGGSVIIIVLALIFIGLGIYVIIDKDDDETPVTP